MATVERENRDRLAAVMRDYLAEETTAFRFADQTWEIGAASSDPTVQFVVSQLWYHYDDCKDHKVVLSKEQWDYFQRLILLLKSDAHVQVQKTRRWFPTQVVAVIALIMFGVLFATCLATLGVGEHLLLQGAKGTGPIRHVSV